MGIFKKNEDTQKSSELNSQLSDQAKRLGLSVGDLEALAVGKNCPKYGTTELLHARKVRGGKIVVFNISERYRGEKISEGRKKIKAQKIVADTIINENNKK
ncbi:MAG: hypothetical protein K2Q26_07790 [Bdellovibrionales bacterium]|nr:hypothetical protein [Bdellovibrionales bacterium]